VAENDCDVAHIDERIAFDRINPRINRMRMHTVVFYAHAKGIELRSFATAFSKNTFARTSR
jgi:hypothetical protein